VQKRALWMAIAAPRMRRWRTGTLRRCTADRLRDATPRAHPRYRRAARHAHPSCRATTRAMPVMACARRTPNARAPNPRDRSHGPVRRTRCALRAIPRHALPPSPRFYPGLRVQVIASSSARILRAFADARLAKPTPSVASGCAGGGGRISPTAQRPPLSWGTRARQALTARTGRAAGCKWAGRSPARTDTGLPRAEAEAA